MWGGELDQDLVAFLLEYIALEGNIFTCCFEFGVMKYLLNGAEESKCFRVTEYMMVTLGNLLVKSVRNTYPPW